MTDVAKTVTDILSASLGRTIADGEVVSSQNDPKWDSFKHVEIMFTIEDELDIRFTKEELGKLRDNKSLIEAAERHCA